MVTIFCTVVHIVCKNVSQKAVLSARNSYPSIRDICICLDEHDDDFRLYPLYSIIKESEDKHMSDTLNMSFPGNIK